MSQYDIIIPILTSNSGDLYEMKEQQKDTQIQHYAFFFSDQFKHQFLEDEIIAKAQIQKTTLLRHYLRFIELQKKYYLFEYVQGQPVSKFIHQQKVKYTSILIEKINIYLKQLLEALYQLHKINILGRVFSVENIIENQDKITLMDFGFGPDFYQTQLNILAPPEVVFSLAEKNCQELTYNIKIDAWLLGAFLFNLVKFYPINSVQQGNKLRVFDYSLLKEYQQFLKQQMETSRNIKVNSSRYPREFLQLIESLLKYDVQDRISFVEIYQSDYIKALKLERINEYIEFYKQLDHSIIESRILLRDGIQQDDFIDSSELIQPFQKLEGPLTNIPRVIQTQSEIPFQELSTPIQRQLLELPFQIQNMSEDIKFARLYRIINMEYFRYFILINTANEVSILISNKKFGLGHVLKYFLTKMGYLILHEILVNLNQKKCDWIQKQEDWQEFQQYNVKIVLIEKITSKIQEKLKELRILHDNCFNDIILKGNIDDCIKNQLIQDKTKLLQNQDEKTNIFDCTSNEFLKSGYRNLTQLLYMFLVQNVPHDDIRTKQYGLILKTLICHLINRVLNYDQINTQFKNIQNQQIDVTPDAIFEFIESKDNDELKINEIQYLVKKYFGSQQQTNS